MMVASVMYLVLVKWSPVIKAKICSWSPWLTVDQTVSICRNLSHPVAQQLESLVEQYNPDYNRKNKQRSKEVWGPKLTKSESLICDTVILACFYGD